MQYDQRDVTEVDKGQPDGGGDERGGARSPYVSPDVDSVRPAMIPELLGTTVCEAPSATNDPLCDAT